MDIKPMFDAEHERHLKRAVDMVMDAMRQSSPREFTVDDFGKTHDIPELEGHVLRLPSTHRLAMSVSLCSEAIAQNLSDASHLKVGAEPRPMRDLIPAQRERFRKLAELAIATIEPNSYESVIESTVGAMLNAQFQKSMDDEELIRETLATFLSELHR